MHISTHTQSHTRTHTCWMSSRCRSSEARRSSASSSFCCTPRILPSILSVFAFQILKSHLVIKYTTSNEYRADFSEFLLISWNVALDFVRFCLSEFSMVSSCLNWPPKITVEPTFQNVCCSPRMLASICPCLRVKILDRHLATKLTTENHWRADFSEFVPWAPRPCSTDPQS